MIKRGITIVTALLILAMTVSLMIMLNRSSLAESDVIASGTYDGVYWRVSSDYELIIGEVGETQSYSFSNSTRTFPWKGQSFTSKIVSVRFEGKVVGNGDMSYMFGVSVAYGTNEMAKLESFNADGFDTSNVTSIGYMFANAHKLANLDLSGFDTSNMTDMSGVFFNCAKLEHINMSTWDTSNVTTMAYMFPTYSVRQVDIGPSFNFKGNGITQLNNQAKLPDNKQIVYKEGTGLNVKYYYSQLKWSRSDGAYGPYTASELINNYTPTMAGTWVTEPYGYAVFDDTDNTLYFVKANEKIDNNTVGTVQSISGQSYTGTIYGVGENYILNDSNGHNISATDFKWRTWASKVTLAEKVVFVDIFRPSSTYYWFNNCSNCEIFDFQKLNTKNDSNMNSMLSMCDDAHIFILGEDFTFKPKTNVTTILPTPPVSKDGISYTQKWVKEDLSNGPYTPTELRDNYNGATMSGKWIWEKADLDYYVTYTYIGNIPFGVSELPIQEKHKQGDEVIVAQNATAPGYTFSEWSRTGTFEMPAEDVEITGSFTPNTDTPYTVEHYLEDLNADTYTLKKTDNLTGTTDTEATATAKEYEGFTFDSSIEGTKQSGNIAGDGSLVLKLYYKRNSYNVTYAYTGDVPDGASELPQSETYKYGEEIKVPEDATAEGYTFSGWIKDYINMPAKDIEITGYFIKEPRLYKIEYYFDNELDEALVEILNAAKDEEINLTPQTPVKHGEKNYTLVSNNHNIIISVNDENNVIRVHYETDVLDYAIDNFEDTTEGDGIPDKYQISITYKVENGLWNDGTKGTKTDIITLKDKDGNLSEEGTGTTNIPEVGNKPSEEYEVGSWNEEIPKEVSNKDDGKEYIYSYKKSEKQNIEQKEETDITEASGKIYNPKTDDIVNKYLLVGIGGILVLALVSKIRRKYSRKAKKIQF